MTPPRRQSPKSEPSPKPDLSLETAYFRQGVTFVAGVDEVGRGCLAGPVVAAAVILDPRSVPDGINDSKKLSPTRREALDELIRERATAWAIGEGSVEEIDQINILQAARLAMLRAVQQLDPGPEVLLVDGRDGIDWKGRQMPVIGGDGRSVSIGAASILAKVYRDRMMAQWEDTYPGFGFAKNKGYGSREHRLQIQKSGPTPIHRKSFQWTPV